MRLFPIILLISFVSFISAQSSKDYISPDKTLIARVTVIGKPGTPTYESRVEILRRGDGRILCDQRYVPPARPYALSILDARWTPDSKFFIFSSHAVGTDDPTHYPTFYFSRKDTAIYDVDPAAGVWVTDPHFRIVDPDRLEVSIRRDSLAPQSLKRSINLSNPKKR